MLRLDWLKSHRAAARIFDKQRHFASGRVILDGAVKQRFLLPSHRKIEGCTTAIAAMPLMREDFPTDVAV